MLSDATLIRRVSAFAWRSCTRISEDGEGLSRRDWHPDASSSTEMVEILFPRRYGTPPREAMF